MAVNVAKPDKYAKCICCGSDKYDMYEFQFFQDNGMKTCVTLCKPCVYYMSDYVIQDTVNKFEIKETCAEKTKQVQQLLQDIIVSSGADREELIEEAAHYLKNRR